jgi:hypothetical protein
MLSLFLKFLVQQSLGQAGLGKALSRYGNE